MEDLVFSEETFEMSLPFEQSDSLMSALLKYIDENPGTSADEALKNIMPNGIHTTDQ